MAVCLIGVGIFVFAGKNSQEKFSNQKALEIKGQAFFAVSFTSEEAEMYKESMEGTVRDSIESTEQEISECDNAEQAKDLEQRLESLKKTNVDKMFEPQADGSIEMKVPHRNAEIVIEGTIYQTDDEGYYVIEDTVNIEKILKNETEVIFVNHGAEIAKVKVLFDKNKENNEIKYKKTFMEFAEGMANM